MRRYPTTADIEAHYAARARNQAPPAFSGRPITTPQPAEFRDVEAPEKVPLTTNQHILHLLLTVFTGGVWLPVWIYLAIRGNRT